jgi:hypothetical protein
MTPIAEVTNSQEPLTYLETTSLFLSNLVEFKKSVFINRLETINFPPSKRPAGINIFSQLSPSETQHSMVLCELLNPRGKHNEGSKFLKLFFDYVIEDIPFDDKKTWIVTAEKERYDVWIRNLDDSTIIIIENKSNLADDQPNQLYRYWYWGINKRQESIQESIKEKRGKILYLTPDSNKLPDNQTMLRPTDPSMPNNIPNDIKDKTKIVFFHQNIDKWLEECIKSVEDKSDICYYLEQYRNFWRLKMKYDIDQINELFRNKKEQWYSFLDLVNQKEEIKNAWWKDFFKKMFKEIEDKGNWKHELKNESHSHCCWFIKGFSPESFCLNVFVWKNNFSLSLGGVSLNKDALKIFSRLLKEDGYEEPLKAKFDKLDEINNDENVHKYVEHCNFIIDHDEINNTEKLAWYAHYEPDKLLQEIKGKIYKFIADENITEIITKINREVFSQQ